ncbi:MAG TPA: FAD-linked oxidase C-terminal domain-containing protein [Bacteroidia bacterium]|jgi:glycolate oxidase|nr:FAD-linked oxidase C-terminal domain-containing protein [Bacteroidia bacterium]HQK97023.1 FAD-linked oxidase C-terminal domain-containing protein [Bacteroidia bacterium]
MYSNITLDTVAALKQICGDDQVFTDLDQLAHYGHDETEDLQFNPAVVVRPADANQVASIMRLANAEHIPVTPRGAGTGLSGGALPVHGGILLSTERFNKIIEIDERNLQATVEPGVINQVFRDAVEAKGLFYPPDPASRGSCFLGGNLAENAGGPRAVKYGTTKDYILNCEVVLPNGEIIWTGANVLKNSTGYNLTQLLIGSEGTLGIVTKIVFRLIPLPTKNLIMLVPFYSPEKACEAVSAVFRAGFTPSAMEFMERDAIDYVMQFVDVKIPVKNEHKAHLLIEVDGNDIDVLFKECEQITELMYQFECDEVMFADTAEQKNELWKMRRAAGEAVKSHSVYKEEDTVVPRAELPRLLKGVKEIGAKYGFRSVCYGHAGDGNLHVNIIKDTMSDEDWKNKVPLGIREIFHLCVELKGTISGEHGIGYVQKGYMDIAFNSTQIELQKGIKRLFDPNNILNPGKMFV